MWKCMLEIFRQPLWCWHISQTLQKFSRFVCVPLYLESPPSSSSQRVHWPGLPDSQAGRNWSSTSLPCSASPPKTPWPRQHHAAGPLQQTQEKGCGVQKMHKQPAFITNAAGSPKNDKETQMLISFLVQSILSLYGVKDVFKTEDVTYPCVAN